MSSWGNLSKKDDALMQKFYDKYVPTFGYCKTLGGEIVRAINRIVYKYYNDGDTVDRYYSSVYNHSKACDNFLCKYVGTYHTLRDIDENDFQKEVDNRLKVVLDYLVANKHLFKTKNVEDCIENSPKEEYDDDYYDEWENDEEYEWEHQYEEDD